MLMIHKGHFQINTSRNNNEQRGNRISAKLVVASLVATLAGSQRSAIVSERVVERSSLGNCRRLTFKLSSFIWRGTPKHHKTPQACDFLLLESKRRWSPCVLHERMRKSFCPRSADFHYH